MLGTFIAWWLLGDTSGLDNKFVLVAFVLVATAAWALGYRWGVVTFPLEAMRRRYGDADENEATQTRSARAWVWASGVYFVLYSYSLLVAYGARPDTFWQVIQHPGDAYQAKFDAAEGLSTQTGNTLLQLLIVFSLWQLPLGPLVGYFWDRLTFMARVVAVFGIVSYVAFFLYIGTMQGLGFLLVGLLAGLLARRHRAGDDPRRARRSRRRTRAMASLGIVAFSWYFINAQADRLDVFEVREYQPNPTIEAIAGRDFARGLAVVAHYPTHGYRGLAFNLDTAFAEPFVWTGFRGFSRAVDSYGEQYLGASVLDQTYPAITERRTGWSATVHWATVYPWLASDFTWPGTLLLMVFIGRWTARMWLRSTLFHDPVALMLFSQLALFIVFISINNQVLISRPALIAVVSCLILYRWRESTAGRQPARAQMPVTTS